MTRRTDRIGDLILQELGLALQRDVRDPRIGFVTFSRIQIAPDLSVADVYVSVFGDEKNKRDSVAGLISSAPFLRKHLARTMRTKTVPKLKFILDEGLDYSDRINEILSSVKEDERP